ncbi:hypothetical protein IRP63_15770 (plasmid) [Clostridium botulinum]|uniref:Uncharacterized protein n=1 Tax=Clostridium botulinum C/D str. DC5 TaxID=1443128 RepID=A0A0A0HWL0_CLOBO|nr:hypothetical protein [Clostridium botulinum]KEI00031.1 hypothetical protein Z952_14505 [Clostridium botulinum C/D str. BKT75002]KEI05815.1 hypothetical protein Z954_14660 [Clostridium botulinum C/D str. BKT2873]KGM92962.1 hypothetical protein Z955_16415 [Clostridium botulinum C/D str. DC5]KOC45931.1 hypothetical protein ADU88_12915 [Clostridium botulinum]KOC50803.1 hypothetical protein ADU89_14315 [Clostridium botulinum]
MDNKYNFANTKTVNKEIESIINAGKFGSLKTTNAIDILNELGSHKVKKSTLSIKVSEDLDKLLDKICTKKKEKANVIVDVILKILYDENKKTFDIDIEKKKKNNDRATSFHIDEKYINAIKTTSKKLNMSSTEYFNRLMIKFIMDNQLIENL